MISYINQDATVWKRAGETIRVTMQGTVGAKATFRIAGLVDSVAMTENSPGRYVGRWQVPDGKTLVVRDAAVTGKLELKGETGITMDAAQAICIDTAAPRVTPVVAATKTEERPLIAATLSDEGSGVDVDSLHLLVNGRDFTSEAVLAEDRVAFTPLKGFTDGEQAVELYGKDRAGNSFRQSWKITAINGVTATISAVTSNAGKKLRTGNILHVEVEGTPGGKATLAVGTLRDIPLSEGAPGHYSTDYKLKKGDNVGTGPLVASLTLTGGKPVERSADSPASPIPSGKNNGKTTRAAP